MVRSRASWPVVVIAGSSGLSRMPLSSAAVGSSRMGVMPSSCGDEVPLADAVLALGVQHDDLAVAEAQLAQDVRLLQRRLAVAGLAEHQPVRGGELLAVQLEGVVDVALAAVDLAADDDAGVAEAGRGGGQVDGLRLARGGAYGQAGRLHLAEEEAGEGVGEDGQRISHRRTALYASGGCRSRTAGCSRRPGGARGRTTPASGSDLPAEARIVRLSRARASGEREDTVM